MPVSMPPEAYFKILAHAESCKYRFLVAHLYFSHQRRCFCKALSCPVDICCTWRCRSIVSGVSAALVLFRSGWCTLLFVSYLILCRRRDSCRPCRLRLAGQVLRDNTTVLLLYDVFRSPPRIHLGLYGVFESSPRFFEMLL